ncbi:MAG: cytochrome d ubiquinol oxidase subunit II [Capsulimonadaceae bacterium]
MIQGIWFGILSLMMATYAVLDGFDFGVGGLLPFLCKTEEEKQQARHAIGPVWNGNEVWLLAGGGAMFAAFPRLYAASFSGFYLALVLVLWLFMLRGIGFEFRHAIPHPMWRGTWDAAFSLSSALLGLLFGVAVGNVLRGVPLNASGEFQGSFALMLNPFALLAGVFSVAVLSLHGAAYLVMKTTGALRERARRFAVWAWVASTALTVAFVVASAFIHPSFTANFTKAPVALVLPVLIVVALCALPVLLKRAGRKSQTSAAVDQRPFLATCLLIVSLLASAAAGLFPRMLPALGRPAYDLTCYNASTGVHGLHVALIINLIGMTVVVLYTAYIYRIWGGKVAAG